MPKMSFDRLLQSLTSHLSLGRYTNELDTMRYIRDEETLPRRELLIELWFHTLEEAHSPTQDTCEMERISTQLRTAGNGAFQGKQRNPLKACRLYTEAIFAAPENSVTLALAHANRAIALQVFGYYRQAYDDCVCALAANYPATQVQKLLLRQAYCALKLGDGAKLKVHLDELEADTSSNVQEDINDLKLGLDKLLLTENSRVSRCEDYDLITLQGKTRIVHSKGPQGRHVIATASIRQHEFLFRDRATAFVPLDIIKICQQCAATQIIPFPCLRCRGRVVYCSVECRDAHAPIHKFECAGYRLDMFKQIGLLHLAFRIVLHDLHAIVPLLQDREEADAIWAELVGDGAVASGDTDCGRSLRLITHIDKWSLLEVLWFACGAHSLLIYLKRKTEDFQVLFNGTTAHQSAWELITASLLLRRVGQLAFNATTITSPAIVAADDLCKYPLLADGLWASPYRMERGCLHKLCDLKEIACACYPYLSTCNHACEQSIVCKYSGCHVWTFASKDIPNGADVSNCYVPDARKTQCRVRRKLLSGQYKFVCDCVKCTAPDPDEDYNKFIRQRCQYPKCGTIFVPQFSAESIEEAYYEGEAIKCTTCSKVQPTAIYADMLALLNQVDNPTSRRLLFAKFDELDSVFLDYHDIKEMLSLMVVKWCLRAHSDGAKLGENEFKKLTRILKFNLRANQEKFGTNSTSYAVRMTFLWDLVALRQCEVARSEMDTMVELGLQSVPDEIRSIYINYYEDFIKPIVK